MVFLKPFNSSIEVVLQPLSILNCIYHDLFNLNSGFKNSISEIPMLAWRIKPVSLPLRSTLSMQPAAGSEWRRTRKKEHSIKCGLILVSTAAASLGCCNRIWRPSKCREVILLRRSGGGVHKSKFNIVSFMCG